MYYYGNVFQRPDEQGSIYNACSESFMKYLPLLREGKTVCDVAFFWPGLVGALGRGIPDGIRPLATFLRRFTTVMPLNEQMIRDGGLSRFKLLIIPPAEFTDRETLHAICEYVKNGGKVLAVGRTADIELDPVEEYDALFGILPESETGVGGTRFTVTDPRFARFAEAETYVGGHGMFGLHPDTVEIAGCALNPHNLSGTTTAAMSNTFMREYPSGGAAIMYMGPMNLEYDPQAQRAYKPVLVSLLQDVLEAYTDSAELFTQAGEQARGYIGDALYALRDDGEITKAE